MFCNKCGNKLDDGARFCSYCGNNIDNGLNTQSVDLNNNQSNNLYVQKNNVNSSNSEDKFGLISLIIGIISLVIVLSWESFGFILGIVGLILGIISKNKDKKKKIGIILNIVALILGIGTITFPKNNEFFSQLHNELDYSTSSNYVAGTWNCSKFDGTSSVGEAYTVTMKLNKDNSFVFGEYGDLSNNHAGGTYTFEDEKDKNESTNNGYKYFIINMSGDSNDYLIDGVSQNRAFDAKFEIGITSVDSKKQAILMNYYTYQMYSCYLEK